MTAGNSVSIPPDADLTEALQNEIHAALADQRPLEILGSGSKRFLGRESSGERLDIAGHRGIVTYEPSELVMTARSGTPLAEIESLLGRHGQMLAFEPPHFGPGATLGGTVACNLAGPRRPYAGATRDFVLGTRVINGKGEILRFGGEVMKNVAGYDISRLMAGAMGTLGLLLEVSLKVLPAPRVEATLAFELDESQALVDMNRWAGRPLPVSAAAWCAGVMYVRLSGSETGVAAACAELGGDEMLPDTALAFWDALKEQRLAAFSGEGVLWRLSLPPATGSLPLDAESVIDWGGAQRWLRTDEDAERVRWVAGEAGGHAVAFKDGDRQGSVFHPMGGVLMQLHRRVKDALDPHGLFNPGRMYAGL
jgi:glycolate oxidase FAD binding subunit